MAAVIPSREAFLRTVGAVAIWFGPQIAAVLLCASTGGQRVAVTVSCAFVGTASWFLVGDQLLSTGPLGLATLGLTSLNLAGPFYVAVRLWYGKPLVAGEILWAWMGGAWMMLLTDRSSHSSHGGVIRMELTAHCARLTLVLVVLLVLYGTRPARPGPVWPHYLGWGLAESDSVAWGWDASSYL